MPIFKYSAFRSELLCSSSNIKTGNYLKKNDFLAVDGFVTIPFSGNYDYTNYAISSTLFISQFIQTCSLLKFCYRFGDHNWVDLNFKHLTDLYWDDNCVVSTHIGNNVILIRLDGSIDLFDMYGSSYSFGVSHIVFFF